MNTLERFLEANKITLSAEYGTCELPYEKWADWQRKAHPYRVTVKHGRRSAGFDFWMGQAHTSEPSVSDVLPCLFDDFSAVQHEAFEDWARDLGYDPDSRAAEAAYKLCRKNGEKLRKVMGDKWDSFVIVVEEAREKGEL